MLDRPIVIIGSPRAGKSCVGKIICASPEFGYFNEPHAVWSWGQRRRSDDRRVAEDITDSLRRKIIGSCEQVLRESGLSRYVDDLATHSLRIPFIRAVIPDVRIIHVIRKPRKIRRTGHRLYFSRFGLRGVGVRGYIGQSRALGSSGSLLYVCINLG